MSKEERTPLIFKGDKVRLSPQNLSVKIVKDIWIDEFGNKVLIGEYQWEKHHPAEENSDKKDIQ